MYGYLCGIPQTPAAFADMDSDDDDDGEDVLQFIQSAREGTASPRKTSSAEEDHRLRVFDCKVIFFSNIEIETKMHRWIVMSYANSLDWARTLCGDGHIDRVASRPSGPCRLIRPVMVYRKPRGRMNPPRGVRSKARRRRRARPRRPSARREWMTCVPTSVGP